MPTVQRWERPRRERQRQQPQRSARARAASRGIAAVTQFAWQHCLVAPLLLQLQLPWMHIAWACERALVRWARRPLRVDSAGLQCALPAAAED